MKEISPSEVEQLVQNGGNAKIVDVRESFEVQMGKIPGAIHIPLKLLEFRMHELDKGEEYILVCHSGTRSALATRFLDYHGYNVKNMTGGMLAWQGPIE